MNYGTGKVALSVGQLRSVYGQLHSILEERMSLVMPGDGDAEGDEDMVRREVQLTAGVFATCDGDGRGFYRSHRCGPRKEYT